MLDPLYYAVSAVMRLWHQLFSLVPGVGDGAAWALSIVFLVLTVRALMIGPALAGARSARRRRAIAPQLAALRARHRHDPVRRLEESRALQARHGVSTWSGLLPALVQAPVFLALLHVLQHFDHAAIPNYAFPAADVRSFLLEARLFGSPLAAHLAAPQEALAAFGAHVERLDVVLVAVPLLVLTAAATFLAVRRTLRTQPVEDGPVGAVQRALPRLLPIGVVAGGVLLPIPVAILLYGLTSAVWTLVQQHLVLRWLERTEPAVAAPPRVAAPRPGAKPVRRRR